MPKYRQTTEQKVVGGVLGGLWFLITLPFRRLKGKVRKPVLNREEIKLRFEKIESIASLGGESHFKNAVLEVDKLLSYVLEGVGARGDTLAERLKNAKNRFSPSTYKGLWSAHKVRNEIVHNVDSELLHFQTKDVISQFKRGLEELGLL